MGRRGWKKLGLKWNGAILCGEPRFCWGRATLLVAPPLEVVPPPMVAPPTSLPVPNKTVAHCTRLRHSISALSSSIHVYPSKFLNKWALSRVLHPNLDLAILDADSVNSLYRRQLQTQPRLIPTWNTSYANKLGRLCQGIGTSPEKTIQRIKGTDTFNIINYDNIPIDC